MSSKIFSFNGISMYTVPAIQHSSPSVASNTLCIILGFPMDLDQIPSTGLKLVNLTDLDLHATALLEFGLWRRHRWTAEDDASSDVDTLNLDYKRTNNIYIYLATMRIMVVGFAFLHLRPKFQYAL